MHDVVHDVREMIVSITFIISTGYAFSHYYKRKEEKKMDGWMEMQAGKVHHASFVLYGLF